MTEYTKVGAETRVNEQGAGSQNPPEIATLANGRTAIAWATVKDGANSLSLRVFGADGAPIGGDVTIESAADRSFSVDSVAALADGGFVVGYFRSNTQTVFTRIYNNDGSPRGDAFAPDPSVMNSQYNAQITGLSNGDFVVLYQNDDSDPQFYDAGTFGRIYHPDGQPVTDIFRINVQTEGYQTFGIAAALADGRFAVTWADFNPAVDGSQTAARVRLFGADGTPETGEIAVNTSTVGSQTPNDIVSLADGGFLIHYTNNQRGTAGVIGSYVQAFDSAGNKVGVEHALPGLPGSFIQLPDGSFAHVYSGDTSSAEVFLQRYDASFEAVGDRQIVNTGTAGDQILGGATATATGFVVSYATGDATIDGDASAVLVQRFGTGASTGTAGNDVLAAPSDAPWSVNGGRGDDDMTGGAGDDSMVGGRGSDVMRGGGGDDRLNGGAGDDTLYGGAGRDVLNGRAGDDRLVGGTGLDVMSGGAEHDAFVFTQDETANGQGGLDARIFDFTRAQGDRIDLSAIDAAAGGQNEAFTFIGSASFSGTAGELRAVIEGSYTFVLGDTDGNGVADLVVRLDGAPALIASDFTL